MPRRTNRDMAEPKSRYQMGDEGPMSRRMRYLDGVKEINPNDYDLIRRFLTEHGKIVPSRLSGTTAKQQRQIKGLVRRLRVMGILP